MGKGYAWNPVGFVERKKDPNISREGCVMATADYVRSMDGNLKTIAVLPVMPVILPVTDGINTDFSSNITANFELHGELAYTKDETVAVLNNANALVQTQNILFNYY